MDMVAKLQLPGCALVHQMPFVVDHPGFAAALEKVFFGTVVARSCQGLHVLNLHCFVGMSYVIKKSVLDEIHGFAWFGRYLSEDYFIFRSLYEK